MEKPKESDCCNSGCNPCILDVYEDYMKRLSKLKNKDQISKELQNCIHPASYSVFRVVSKEKHTPNSCIFIFEYCGLSINEDKCDEKKLMYEPGQHFLLKGKDSCSAEQFTRAYTPIPYGENSKSFTILVRLYDRGKMSAYLSDLQVGNETLWRGPYGNFKIDYKKQNILFIAQGTGIAPIFSIISDMLSNENCETFLHLFFCCRNGHEILLRSDLYKMRAHWNFNYELFINDVANTPPKYEEVIHNRKLERNDIATAINKKPSVQVVICGSTQFGNYISECARDNRKDDDDIYVFE